MPYLRIRSLALDGPRVIDECAVSPKRLIVDGTVLRSMSIGPGEPFEMAGDLLGVSGVLDATTIRTIVVPGDMVSVRYVENDGICATWEVVTLADVVEHEESLR